MTPPARSAAASNASRGSARRRPRPGGGPASRGGRAGVGGRAGAGAVGRGAAGAGTGAGARAAIGRVASVGASAGCAPAPTARSSSATNAEAVAGRSAGSLAMPRSSTAPGLRRQARDGARVGHRGLDVGPRLGRGAVGRERPLPGEQLVGDGRQRVAVAGGGRRVPQRLLGRDVGRRPEHLAGLGDRCLAGHGRDPEVAHGEAAAIVEQQVRGLDVAMHDVLGVRGVQRGGRLGQPADGQRARDRLAAAQPVGHRAAGEVLHDHERAGGWGRALADVEHGHDVRVVAEPRAGASLAREALVRALVLRVGGCEDLDRDEPAEELVLGGPDGGHPAVGDVPHDAVAGRAG